MLPPLGVVVGLATRRATKASAAINAPLALAATSTAAGAAAGAAGSAGPAMAAGTSVTAAPAAAAPAVPAPPLPVPALVIERVSAIKPLPPLLVDGTPATILTLRDTMCKWPIGDPADPKFAFCGRKSDCGPYCAEHAQVAFQPARKREARKSEYDYVRRIAG